MLFFPYSYTRNQIMHSIFCLNSNILEKTCQKREAFLTDIWTHNCKKRKKKHAADCLKLELYRIKGKIKTSFNVFPFQKSYCPTSF